MQLDPRDRRDLPEHPASMVLPGLQGHLAQRELLARWVQQDRQGPLVPLAAAQSSHLLLDRQLA